MNDLIAVEKIAQWEKLKTLVLDSVSSPITKRVYNMALNEFMAWFQQAPRPGFTKATVSAWRVSLEERRLGSSSIIIRMSAIRKLAAEAADNGLLAPELAPGHQPREEREIDRHPRWELAVAAAGAGAPERAGHHDRSRPARPRDPRRSSRLRTAAIGSGGAHVRACPAARRTLVHRRSRREARTRPDGADADVGEGGDRRMDVAGRRCRRPRIPPGESRGRRHRRTPGREGRLADASSDMRPRSAFPASRPMICGAPARSCAARPAVSLSRSSAAGPCVGSDDRAYLGTKQDLVHAPNDAIKLRLTL